MRLTRLFAVVLFTLILAVTASADCRNRIDDYRTIRVKVLKWKTLASGERWTSFFVETADVCDPKTGTPMAYLLICRDTPGDCPDARNDMTYDARLLRDEIRGIKVDQRLFRLTSVAISCGLAPPIKWIPIRTDEADTVRCTAADLTAPAANVSTVRSIGLLPGTTWYQRDTWLNTDTGAKIVFSSDGKATVTLHNKKQVEAAWQLQGAEVTIEGPDLRIKATIKGDRMEGTQIPAGPMGSSWLAIRRP